MPIKPENINRYPNNWKQISERIRFERAKNKCEICGVDNYSIGYRNNEGVFIKIEPTMQGETDGLDAQLDGFKIIKIILTVAHLDHIPENCEDDNLKAMCQKCHNLYDTLHRKQTRNETRYKNQIKLL